MWFIGKVKCWFGVHSWTKMPALSKLHKKDIKRCKYCGIFK